MIRIKTLVFENGIEKGFGIAPNPFLFLLFS